MQTSIIYKAILIALFIIITQAPSPVCADTASTPWKNVKLSSEGADSLYQQEKLCSLRKEFYKEESDMKKVLSIVLSLAMVVCMMPLTAFAASASNTTYSDIAGENCEGAVNVLTALGVVDGYEDGTCLLYPSRCV